MLPDQRRAAEDGDLAARVFARLSEGAKPVDLVEEFRVAPERIRALAREWRALKAEESRPAAAALAVPETDRLKPLSDTVNALAIRVGGIEEFSVYVNEIDRRLGTLEQSVAELMIGFRRQHAGIREALIKAAAAEIKIRSLECSMSGIARLVDDVRRSIPQHVASRRSWLLMLAPEIHEEIFSARSVSATSLRQLLVVAHFMDWRDQRDARAASRRNAAGSHDADYRPDSGDAESPRYSSSGPICGGTP